MQILGRALVLLALCAAFSAAAADTPPSVTVATVETAFLDYLDAVGAVGFIESGGAKSFGGRDLAAWTALVRLRARHAEVAARPARPAPVARRIARADQALRGAQSMISSTAGVA